MWKIGQTGKGKNKVWALFHTEFEPNWGRVLSNNAVDLCILVNILDHFDFLSTAMLKQKHSLYFNKKIADLMQHEIEVLE